jgi:hypothetical protein
LRAAARQRDAGLTLTVKLAVNDPAAGALLTNATRLFALNTGIRYHRVVGLFSRHCR